MKYYKLHKHVYLAVYEDNKPYLFFNIEKPKGWTWGAVNSWGGHSGRHYAQSVCEFEVLVVCGSVPSEEEYVQKHFPEYEERYN